MMIQIDDEELEALIDFQRAMIEQATESLERGEVTWRTKRLSQLLGKQHQEKAR